MSDKARERIIEALKNIIDSQQREIASKDAEIDRLREIITLVVDTHNEGGWPTAVIVIAEAAIAQQRGVSECQ